MSKLLLYGEVALGLLLLSIPIRADEPAANEPALLAPRTLVKARVIGVETARDGDFRNCKATVRITHVYRGQPRLLNMTFTDYSSSNGELSRCGVACPTYEEGEEGIWALRQPESESMPNLDFPVGSRARKTSDHCYAQTEAVAEAIEKLSKDKSSTLIENLQKEAHSRVPMVSAWAIRNIGSVRPVDEDRRLQKLVFDSSLSAAGRMAIDEVWCERKRDSWRRSKERLLLLEKSMRTSISDQYTEGLLIDRLFNVAHARDYDFATVVRLIRLFHEGDARGDRRDALSIVLNWPVKEAAEKELQCEVVAGRIRQARTPTQMCHACYSLRWLAPLSLDRIAKLGALKTVVTHTEAKKELEQGLAFLRSASSERIAELIKDLDSRQFKVREKASEELERLGEPAKDTLRKALAGNPSLEVRRRIERLLKMAGQEP